MLGQAPKSNYFFCLILEEIALFISILKLVQECNYIVIPWINMIYIWYFPYIKRSLLIKIIQSVQNVSETFTRALAKCNLYQY